ncbi:uncharacterized protein K489DRAFT_177374 [Dissoconium aciculare CBS 342.82]|uniref:Uncharacterized protein n=1 Tax=Dissoconium aciculare CBS 342.82 TaxID=1314786 RepID=A0A6J3M8A4_9PEZI|nr:uncharacterized protein K489DRAFT_177374 [Dissoconium aciculare CBS 342.82]KAF1824225.1 hypothetical protein K489DRAFT_177374 [Dissoconium aciculare CBS 342.82]
MMLLLPAPSASPTLSLSPSPSPSPSTLAPSPLSLYCIFLSPSPYHCCLQPRLSAPVPVPQASLPLARPRRRPASLSACHYLPTNDSAVGGLHHPFPSRPRSLCLSLYLSQSRQSQSVRPSSRLQPSIHSRLARRKTPHLHHYPSTPFDIHDFTHPVQFFTPFI